MIGLVMAGGRGSRMNGGTEKLLLQYKKHTILHVIDALTESGCVDKVNVATSPHAPKTHELIHKMGIHTIQTAGNGYSLDLGEALDGLSGIVLVVSGDLPLLDGEMVQDIAARFDPKHDWTSIVATDSFVDSIGIQYTHTVQCAGYRCVYTGVSLVNADAISRQGIDEHYTIIDDRRIAFNMNTRREYGLLGVAGDASV